MNYHYAKYQECCRCDSKCVPSLCFSSRPHHKIILLGKTYRLSGFWDPFLLIAWIRMWFPRSWGSMGQ